MLLGSALYLWGFGNLSRVCICVAAVFICIFLCFKYKGEVK